MPNRILRARLRQSERFNKCSTEEQNLYVRLIMLVDDFGRYEAHPTLLASEAYPYGEPVSGQPIPGNLVQDWLTGLKKNDLLLTYRVDDKEFLQLKRWRERLRSDASAFPDPPQNGACMSHDSQMTVTRQSNARSQSQSQSQSPKPKPTSSPKPKPSSKPNRGFEKMNTFLATKIANAIITNVAGWYYDNCKVAINQLKTNSLKTVIEPFIGALTEKEIHAAWAAAVFTAHGAKVDNLARDATAYSVKCFKNQLEEKQKGKGEK